MKKLLLVLMVVALASFLLVGCLPGVVVDEDEDEDDGDGVVGDCPTVAVTTQVEVEGKTYIKGGTQTITVTFAVPIEPVSVFVGSGLRNGWWWASEVEVVMYANPDKTIYTGEFEFGDYNWDCGEAYIYVETCETCAACKYPYTVDSDPPYVALELSVSGGLEDCPCGGCALTVSSVIEESTCDPDVECCGDDCSGLASWSFRLFDEYPWNVCCDTACEDPIFDASGTDCPIEFTTDCLEPGETYWAIVNLVDNVGNETNVAVEFHLNECYIYDIYFPELPEACDYDGWDYCWNDEVIIFIDLWGMMDEDCWNICDW